MTYENDPCVAVVPHTPDPNFKLEAVVVCDRYHDFLRCTLPQNKFLFDKMVVVTSPEDRETQRVCEFYHVECVLTDALRSRWKQFCKGSGINEGLARLSKRDWVVHLDADMWLPPLTRNLLANANLAKRMIYGIDRFIVKGYKAWDEFLELPKLQQECNAFIHLNNSFPLGTRIMQDYAGGYVPIGFFQMWHPKVSGIAKYPEGHTTAGREDTLFPQQWPRGLRDLFRSWSAITWRVRILALGRIGKGGRRRGLVLRRLWRGCKNSTQHSALSIQPDWARWWVEIFRLVETALRLFTPWSGEKDWQ